MPLCLPYVDSPIGRYVTATTIGSVPDDDFYPGLVIFETSTQRVYQYDGGGTVVRGEPPESFTPTVSSGVSGGNWSGSFYHRHDGFIDFAYTLTDTGGNITGDVRVSLPRAPYVGDDPLVEIPAAGRLSAELRGPAGARYLALATIVAETDLLRIQALDNASFPKAVNLSSTVPFTWNTGHTLHVSGSYRMSSRYL